MPILANAKKALRVSQRKAAVNRMLRSKVKTTGDAFRAAPSSEALAKAYQAIDKAVKKNIFHRNKAARLKSQLAKLLPAQKAETKKAATGKTAKPVTKKPAAKKSASKTAAKKPAAKKAASKKAAPKKAAPKSAKK